MIGNEQLFSEVRDDCGITYVVPVDQLDAWYDWVAAVQAGQADGDKVPDWAHFIGARNVQFSNWRIG